MSGSSNADYYKILGVNSEASVDEIKKIIPEISLTISSGSSKADSDKSQAEARFKEISEAYEVLSDTQQRQRYDLTRGLGAGGMGVEWARWGEWAGWVALVLMPTIQWIFLTSFLGTTVVVVGDLEIPLVLRLVLVLVEGLILAW